MLPSSDVSPTWWALSEKSIADLLASASATKRSFTFKNANNTYFLFIFLQFLSNVCSISRFARNILLARPTTSVTDRSCYWTAVAPMPDIFHYPNFGGISLGILQEIC